MGGNGTGSAKRLLDELGRVHLSSSWKHRPHEETTSSAPPMSAPVHGSTLENFRVANIARSDGREPEKRLSSPHVYRIFSSAGESHADNSVKSEIRAETRDSSKEGNIILMEGESGRDINEEHISLCKESKKECLVSDKVIRDVKFGESSRMNEGTIEDANQEWEGQNTPCKSDSSAGNNSFFRKETKEYHRGTSYLENSSGVATGGLESWCVSQPLIPPQAEARKDGPTYEKYREWGKKIMEIKLKDEGKSKEKDRKRKDGKLRDLGEKEWERRVIESEWNGDGKFKEKDRKRKDIKHNELGEREWERSGHGNFKSGNNSIDCMDSMREDVEIDKYDRSLKYPIKDKEKDHRGHLKIDAGVSNTDDDSSYHHGKGGIKYFIRKQDHHEMEKEPLKQNDFDGSKNMDKEVRVIKSERDADVEGDRMEVQTAICENEMEDGGTHGYNCNGREKEAFPNEVQQRKRMVRTRGSSQMINRELRIRSHSLEVDGLQGKNEMPAVMYKVGECMHELEKLWKDYESSQSWINGDCSKGGPTLAIRILAEHITATNRQVRGGQLWGTDVYTDDSDLVAVLMHTGYCRPTASPPPHNVLELYATIIVLAPQDCYISTLRNNVRSRAWGSAICCSYRVESCCVVLRDGGKINLEPCLTHTSTIEPTLAPVVVERSMTTRAAASNALRQQRFVREVTIQYNLCNEPWIKYSISIVADKGLKKPLYTSARLKKGDVLYLETPSCRYELCFSGEKIIKAAASSLETEVDRRSLHDLHNSSDDRKMADGDNVVIDVYRWSWCKTPIPQKLMQTIGIPLPAEHVEVVADNVEWENVQWSQTGVWVAGKEYAIARVHFLSPQ